MPNDTEKHEALLCTLKAAQGSDAGPFEQAITEAFEHVCEHLSRLSRHVSSGDEGSDRPLGPGETRTMR